MSDNVSLAKANAIVATATSTTCGICDEEISEADKAQIALKKLASGYCLADSYALRAFQQCCKAQKTESQMDRLRDENKELWKGTVLAFREQRRTGRGTNFDVLKHLETVKKAFVQDNDDVWRPLIFAAYVKHYMNLPQPFTLTEAQATAQWHSDLRNPQIKKSEKKYFNPKSRQDEVLTRVHVQVDEVEHRRETIERSQQITKESTSKSASQSKELVERLEKKPMDVKAFKAGEIDLTLEIDDELGLPSSFGRGRRNTKGSAAASGANPKARPDSGKKPPKIENMEVIATSKANVLMVSLESVQKALRSQIEAASTVFDAAGCSVQKKTHELIARGVREEDISQSIVKGTDPYNLGGTSKSVYKCAFQFEKRVKLAKLLIGDIPLDLDTSYEKELKSAGFFPEGFAEIAVPCHLLMDLKVYLLEDEHTRAGIDEQAKKVRLMLTGFRTMTSALKKGCSDMTSALNTVKAAAALQDKQSQDGTGTTKPKAKAKAKTRAAKLPTYASTSDPSVIKIHRLLVKQNEIARASSFEALKTARDGDEPFILRRGKNIYKLVWKDDTVRTLVTAQVDDFKAKWPKSNQKVQCNLIPPGVQHEENPELSTAQQDVLALVPGDSDWPFIPEEAVLIKGDKDSKKREDVLYDFFSSCFLAGQRRDFIHHGAELSGLGSVKVQLEGSRIICMALATEIASYLQSHGENTEDEITMAKCSSWLLRIESGSIPKVTEMPSLCAGSVKPGDVLYTPPGYLIVDKVVNEDAVSVRLSSWRRHMFLVCFYDLIRVILFAGSPVGGFC
ncbi:DnaJ-like 1 [Durusdinium trenchii]|uniref:Mitochondrial n=1 Tax=Durusdinium trenchii TaxID=1381693 RepID=A0ABP0RFT6_9DINO